MQHQLADYTVSLIRFGFVKDSHAYLIAAVNLVEACLYLKWLPSAPYWQCVWCPILRNSDLKEKWVSLLTRSGPCRG